MSQTDVKISRVKNGNSIHKQLVMQYSPTDSTTQEAQLPGSSHTQQPGQAARPPRHCYSYNELIN